MHVCVCHFQIWSVQGLHGKLLLEWVFWYGADKADSPGSIWSFPFLLVYSCVNTNMWIHVWLDRLHLSLHHLQHLHRSDGKETDYTQDILYFLNVFLLHRPLGFDILISQKKTILTEISHSAKVTKHTIRINNPRTWEDSSVGERTWVQSLEYRHDIMHL